MMCRDIEIAWINEVGCKHEHFLNWEEEKEEDNNLLEFQVDEVIHNTALKVCRGKF